MTAEVMGSFTVVDAARVDGAQVMTVGRSYDLYEKGPQREMCAYKSGFGTVQFITGWLNHPLQSSLVGADQTNKVCLKVLRKRPKEKDQDFQSAWMMSTTSS